MRVRKNLQPSSPSSEREIDGDGRPSDDNDRTLADEGQRRSVPLLTAANDSSDTLRGEIRTTEASKRGQLRRGFRRFILEVEMFEFELRRGLARKTRNDLRESRASW